MNITIVHIGGSEKVCAFESFDGPRPWARLRYPNGAGAEEVAKDVAESVKRDRRRWCSCR